MCQKLLNLSRYVSKLWLLFIFKRRDRVKTLFIKASCDDLEVPIFAISRDIDGQSWPQLVSARRISRHEMVKVKRCCSFYMYAYVLSVIEAEPKLRDAYKKR